MMVIIIMTIIIIIVITIITTIIIISNLIITIIIIINAITTNIFIITGSISITARRPVRRSWSLWLPMDKTEFEWMQYQINKKRDEKMEAD